ncbi:MAG: FlgD immunoglobulin-like domain containing protein [bacterium]
MKNRILSIAFLALVSLMLFGAKNSFAQNRRGEPNVLATGYYVVDSDDNAPLPWRPNYFFIDTLYQPFSWYRIKSGPRQNFPGDRPWHFFYNPLNGFTPAAIAAMDTVNDCMAGPIPTGFPPATPFDFYGLPFDSLFISSNGYIGFRPFAEATAGNPPLYCNHNFPDYKNGLSTIPPATIGALFCDADFRPNGDSTKVYIRTSPGVDSFFVSYFNLRLNPTGNNNIENGSGRDKLFIKKLQIVFTRIDSSIQINYGPFSGAVQGFPPVQAYRIFQRNASIGLINSARTEATSVNYGSHSGKGRWDAINATCRSCNKDFRQAGQFAVKFKRWHNVVRAISVDFPTRNFEVCLSTTLNPTATFQWIGNYDITNTLTPQAFKVKFQIRNAVTGVAVYGRTYLTPVFTTAGQKLSTKVGDFAPYVTNPYILNELGTFNACAIATSYDGSDNYIGDQWPFDDTVCVQIYGIRVTALPFNDPSDNYSITPKGNIPDQQKWVAIGATVEDGDAVTFDPPPPRYDAASGGVGGAGLHDPVIHLDRQDIDGNSYPAPKQGDTLRSFPFNLQGQTKAALAFSYQRAGQLQYPWFWDSQTLLGPEATVLDLNNGLVLAGDSMIIDFKNPSAPACNPGASWTRVGGVDGGNDFEFHKFSVRLDQFTTPTFNYFTNAFRFRLRLKASDNGNYPPDDDADDWYIDNISLQVPRKPEIEVMWVRVVSPYTHIPPSQAVALPIYVHVANNSTDVAIAFPIRVQILDPNGSTVYWALQTVTSLRGGTDSTVLMPNWNAQSSTAGGTFTIHAFLASSSYDSYTQDNGTFTQFFLDVGTPGDPPEFALDDGSNDFPGLVQQTGTGVGFNNNSASLAMKFRLSVKDTMFGVRVYFGNANQSPDAIRLTVLKGSPNSAVPTCDTVFGAQMEDVRKGQLFNQYWSYYFPTPVVLPGGSGSGAAQGVYWVSLSQLGLDNMNLGADISRGGGHVTKSSLNRSLGVPVYHAMYNDIYGTNIAQNNNFGDVSTSYAVERTAGSCDWSLWMPSQGGWWPGNDAATASRYYLYWSGAACDACALNVWGGMNWGGAAYFQNFGTYNPMIRPMVSTSPMFPVNFLSPLAGKEVNGTAVLNWTTAQEKQNSGFYVERRLASETDGFFTKLGFVEGKGTSNVQNGYSYTDRKVEPGTYTYRLTQIDLDGAQHLSNSVNVSIGSPSSYALEQNHPNPCTTTNIDFALPVAGQTHLIVFNALGQAVRTLVDGDVAEGSHSVKFDGKDDAGNELASGNYIYRLQSGDFSATRKMTITK